MSKTARGKQYTFEDVARLVCKGADPPEGLVRHLRFWARPMEGFPKIELEPPLGRKQMVDALKELSSAADVILGSLARQPMEFVMAPKYPPFDRILLIDLLWDLKRRCHDSIFSPPLASAKGGVKRGPGHIAHPDGTNPMLFCAGAILLAWRVLHGAYPGSRNPFAAEAAEAMFRLATGPAGKADSQPKRSSRAAAHPCQGHDAGFGDKCRAKARESAPWPARLQTDASRRSAGFCHKAIFQRGNCRGGRELIPANNA